MQTFREEIQPLFDFFDKVEAAEEGETLSITHPDGSWTMTITNKGKLPDGDTATFVEFEDGRQFDDTLSRARQEYQAELEFFEQLEAAGLVAGRA